MKKLLFIPLLFVFVSSLSAQITFVFHDGSSLVSVGSAFDNEEGSATFEQGGVTLTAEAFLDGVSSGTDLNGSGDGFGVNALGGGDVTARFDQANGIESIVFSFNVAGTFDSIDLRYVDESAEAVLSFDGGNTFDLFAGSGNEISASDDTFTIAETVAAGQHITLSIANLGVNFGLEAFTITPSAIPEPSTYALIFGGLALGLVIWKRRRA